MPSKPTYEELESRVRELEEARRRNEGIFNQLFELESDALFLIDHANGRILEANRAATRMYGYSRKELLQLRNSDLSAEPESTSQAMQDEPKVEPERYHRKKDGTLFPVEITGSYFQWKDRRLHFAAVREIGWRLQAEAALQKHEMHHQEIAASLPGAIYQFVINADGSHAVPYISAGADGLFGRPASSLTRAQHLFDDIHPDDLARFRQSIVDAARQLGRWTQEFRIVKPDGRITWLQGISNPRPRPDGSIEWNGVLLDITDRRLAEEKLTEMNRFIRAVLDNLPIGVAVNSVEPDVHFDYMNNNFPAFYRTTREAIVDPDAFWEAVYEDRAFREEIKGRILEDCASGDPARMHWVDVPITRKGFETSYITAQNIPMPGQPFVISVVWDVTERKRIEERIKHLNRVLRTIRDVNKLVNFEQDQKALIDKGCRLLVERRGYTAALIVLTDDERPVHWAEAGMGEGFDGMDERFRSGWLPSCCGRSPADGGARLVDDREICGNCPFFPHCTENHSLCMKLVHGGIDFGYLVAAVEPHAGVDHEERAVFAELAGDLAFALNVLKMNEARKAAVRKRLSLEKQLIQAQKMESVGRLAGGVAHDYNNMLSVIIGYTELTLEKIDGKDPLHEDLEEILNAANRSAEITRQLLAFARQQTIAPVVLDLNLAVEGLLKMLRRLLGEDIDLAWLPKPDLWPIRMDPAQIDQILANLCVNARDAISGVGRITIETGKVTLDEAYCADHAGFRAGEFVLLAVSDNGSGMNRETRDKLFEPFFTTKPMGKGTGLGLATVYGIVKQNDGFINVYSEPGKGTTFRIYLPSHTGQKTKLEEKHDSRIPLGQNETILVVEDDPAILKVARKMLERTGYKVLAVNTPSEAIRLAEAHKDAIDLLITDVVMPQMNGRELAEKIHSHVPEMKIMYMSGYTANVIAHRGILEEGVNFIQKPLSGKDLAVKVREVLGKGS